MENQIQTIIIRHPKERLSKCSLQPLIHRKDLTFLKSTPNFTFDATNHILLCLDAPELTIQDKNHPLLLIDSTWRLLPQIMSKIKGSPIRRTLSSFIQTAYPRISKIGPNPHQGLASVEALFVAKYILGDHDPSLLDSYHWKDPFLENFYKHFQS